MRIGCPWGTLLLCAFMQKPYITLNHDTKSLDGHFQTRVSGNFLISSGTFKDFKSCKSSEMHWGEKTCFITINYDGCVILSKYHPKAQSKNGLSLYHYTCYKG